MDYVTVGSTGVQVSPLCFGAMSFGTEADEATSGAMFKRVRDAGINFFDTANVYCFGASEQILGRLIADARDELVISSKVGFAMGSDGNAQGLSRRHIVLALDAAAPGNRSGRRTALTGRRTAGGGRMPQPGALGSAPASTPARPGRPGGVRSRGPTRRSPGR